MEYLTGIPVLVFMGIVDLFVDIVFVVYISRIIEFLKGKK